MANIRSVPLPWTTVYAISTAEAVIPATGYMTAQEVAKYRGNFDMRAPTGNISVALGYQTCNVESSPDAHTVVTAFETTATVVFGTAFTDIASTMQGKQLVRIVWVTKLTSGGVLAMARVAGSVDLMAP